MYKVIKAFYDLQDNEFEYNVGDKYPRGGYEPTKARIVELSGVDNMQNEPLIVETKQKKPTPKSEKV